MNNYQDIKVSEALRKGNSWINIPCYLLFFVFFFVIPAILFFIFINDKNNTVLIIGSISSILLGIFLPFLWWSINVVKYKIWAAKNVKDIHRFYHEAQTKNLINERKFFRNLEIKSEKQKKELVKFYERLSAERILVRDVDNSIPRETIFKSGLKWNILIFLILIGGLFYMNQSGNYNLKITLIFSGVLLILIAYNLYKIFRYKFILKVNDDLISYKDDKNLIYWKDIVNYVTIPGVQNTSSKLIIKTSTDTFELALENYGSIKLGKVIDVLNENKHRFDINQSVR